MLVATIFSPYYDHEASLTGNQQTSIIIKCTKGGNWKSKLRMNNYSIIFKRHSFHCMQIGYNNIIFFHIDWEYKQFLFIYGWYHSVQIRKQHVFILETALKYLALDHSSNDYIIFKDCCILKVGNFWKILFLLQAIGLLHSSLVHTTSKNEALCWYFATNYYNRYTAQCAKDYQTNVKLIQLNLTKYLFTHYLHLTKQYLQLRIWLYTIRPDIKLHAANIFCAFGPIIKTLYLSHITFVETFGEDHS